MAETLAPDETVHLLAGEMAAFEADLAELSEADLDRPSACSEWTVGEVVGHLTWAGPYFALIVDRALRGDPSPPIDLPPGPARRQRIADLAKESRAELGGSLREGFHEANQELLASFARIGPADWDRPCAHRVGALRYLPATRVNELALHGWDIWSRLEPPGHLRSEALPVVLDVLSTWAPLLYPPDSEQSRPVRIRFTFPDPGLAPRELVIAAAGAQIGPAGGETPDLVLRCPAEVPPLLLLGRIDEETAVKTYGLTLEGDRVALDLLRARSGAF